jgi:hypothetical protein
MDPKSVAVFDVEFRDDCAMPETAEDVAEPDELVAVTVTQ